MRKATVLLMALSVVTVMTTGAFGWGFGTHAYVASEIGKRGGDPNLMEVYGATLPDLFNYAFDADCDFDALYAVTHDDNFLEVFDTKNRGLEKWIAKGLVMHNQPFGIDHTAHIQSQTLGDTPEDPVSGYVNVKAEALNTYLMSAWLSSPAGAPIYPLQVVLMSMGMTPDADMVHQLYHTIIEYSADLMLIQAAPWVGPTLAGSADFWNYSEPFPLVLADAFADDVDDACGNGIGEPETFIQVAEIYHRNVVLLEAGLLSITDPGEVLLATSDHLATFGMGYLGISYDPEDPVSQGVHDQFAALSYGYMYIAMNSFLDDYFTELEATVSFVKQNMIDNGVIKK
jgi:hypothetical protein